VRGACFPSPSTGGEGRAALAAKGEGGVLSFAVSAPSPSLGFASHLPLPLKGARGVEGEADCLEHSIDVGHHVGIGEPDYAVASGFEGARAGGVIGLPLAVGVAVELDDQALAPACEVGDVGGEDDLFLELDAEAVAAEVLPEAALGLGEPFAEVLGAVSGFDVALHGSAPAPSRGAGVPLPRQGARGKVRHFSVSVHESPAVNA
jgi:hypothetical protein